MVFACSYGTDWLGINFLVILAMFLLISFLYLLSRILPAYVRGRFTSLTKVEITQIFISVFILIALASVTNMLCNGPSSYVATLIETTSQGVAVGFPQSHTSTVPFPALVSPVVPSADVNDPFLFSESYVSSYAFEIGPELGIQVYAYSYTFSILSGLWYVVGDIVTNLIPAQFFPPFLNRTVALPGGVQMTFASYPGIDVGIPYGMLSNVFLDYLSPLVIVGIGIMLVQYLVLIIADTWAFSVILPIALIVRTLAFSGGWLRNAANSLLAIAIALYIIYPVMIIFDAYMVHWIFTICAGGVVSASCNPGAVFLQATYTHDTLQGVVNPVGAETINLYGIGIPISDTSILGSVISIGAQVGQAVTGVFGYGADQTIVSVQTVILEVSEFLFIVIVMFAINLTVTVGFSMGLAKALNNGIEGAASFWSSL